MPRREQLNHTRSAGKSDEENAFSIRMIVVKDILEYGQKIPVVIDRQAARSKEMGAGPLHFPEGNVFSIDRQVEICSDGGEEDDDKRIAIREAGPSEVLRFGFGGAVNAAEHENNRGAGRKMRRQEDEIGAVVSVMDKRPGLELRREWLHSAEHDYPVEQEPQNFPQRGISAEVLRWGRKFESIQHRKGI